jgi:predicted O-methyltransferase YrrM
MTKTWRDIDGHFNYACLYDRVVRSISDGAVLVEIGCWQGRSTVYLASCIKDSGKAAAFYAIDHGRGGTRKTAVGKDSTTAGILAANILDCGVEDFVVQIVAPSVRAVRLFHDGTVDFCFIDGSHDYQSVLRDIAAWWPKIRIGGSLAGHDYTARWPGVGQAVNEFFQSNDCTAKEIACCWSVDKY